MVHRANNPDQEHGPAAPGRRQVLTAGAALIAAPLLAGAGTGVPDTKAAPAANHGPFSTRAYGASSATSAVGPMQIQRRAVGANDVLIDILYCGICHTDIHYVREEWAATRYPCVPGHEIVGRVAAVGGAVSKFKVGDVCGVGTMVDFLRYLRELPCGSRAELPQRRHLHLQLARPCVGGARPRRLCRQDRRRRAFRHPRSAGRGSAGHGASLVRRHHHVLAGSVILTPLFGATAATQVTAGHVSFEPGARSAWHTHPAGQILIITSGVGWVQEWNGDKREVRPGDVIWTPPNVKHWHGATATNAMSHIAIQEMAHGNNVEWMETVSDDQYGGAP